MRLEVSYTSGLCSTYTKDGQQNVDTEISTTSSLKEDTNRWEEDGQDDLADIGSCERHFDGSVEVCSGAAVVEGSVKMI